jgi:hypothetical protein
MRVAVIPRYEETVGRFFVGGHKRDACTSVCLQQLAAKSNADEKEELFHAFNVVFFCCYYNL